MKLLAFCLIVFVLHVGWKRWLLAIPQPLPPTSTTATSSILPGTYYEVSVPPTKEDQYLSADYRLWIPNRASTVRGLIVKQHGCGDPASASGLEHANDLQWQALAAKHQFALLGTKLPTGNKPCENWAFLDGGSEKAFLKALDAFAQKSDRPELPQVPWVLWGHSGGADWAIQMLEKYSDKIVTVVALRGGGVAVSEQSQIKSKILDSNLNSKLLEVPVLWALGKKEPSENRIECLELPKQIFWRYRTAGAPWTLAIEANTAHESGDTRFLAIPYLDALITKRLVKDNHIHSIDKTEGWLADPVTHKIAISNEFDNPLEAVWLPNEETARKWQKYVTTGKISPTHKPKQPTNVSATKINSTEVLITWNFTPDLEDGLPSFRIYRNNSSIQTFQGQKHNFGDAPEPPSVALEFRDRQAFPNPTYTVAAFNKIGKSVSQPAKILELK